jgi:SPASM domain peptide maturase of grasp-with-spasm system
MTDQPIPRDTVTNAEPRSLFTDAIGPAPAHVLLLEKLVFGDSYNRFCESKAARATSYDCTTFYKHISRPLPIEREQQKNLEQTSARSLCARQPSADGTDEKAAPAPFDDSSVFRLFATCIPVRGARRSIICDVQTHSGHTIPNGLFGILTEFEGLTIGNIKRQYRNEFDQTIDEYFAFLLERGYGFLCDEPDRFPKLDLSWNRPDAITNAIIDIDHTSQHDYQRIFSELDDLGCQAVQLRSYDVLPIDYFRAILQSSAQTRLRHIDLVLHFDPDSSYQTLEEFCEQYQRISRVMVHSSPRFERRIAPPFSTLILYVTAPLTPTSCGNVSVDYFSLGLEHFTEAHHFNSCLNRKISIAVNGDIKSCPAMSVSYGNTSSLDLQSAARHPTLVQIASITKDKVVVCRDCEFRYICTDCRAFTTEPGNLYSKPEKCSYDPYSATWYESPL